MLVSTRNATTKKEENDKDGFGHRLFLRNGSASDGRGRLVTLRATAEEIDTVVDVDILYAFVEGEEE